MMVLGIVMTKIMKTLRMTRLRRRVLLLALPEQGGELVIIASSLLAASM